MDINALRAIRPATGNIVNSSKSSVLINNGSQDYIVIPNITDFRTARSAYSFMLTAVNDGQLATDKVVGLWMYGDRTGTGRRQQFATAGLLRENIADVINVLSKLHLDGWDGFHNMVRLDLKGVTGVVMSEDVKFSTNDCVPLPDLKFVEKGVKLFTLSGKGESVHIQFLIMRGYGPCCTDDIVHKFRHIETQSDEGVEDNPYLHFIFINCIFNMSSGIRLFPVNISSDDILQSYGDVTHFIGNELYIPVKYSNNMDFNYLKKRLDEGLNEHSTTQMHSFMSRHLCSMLSKENTSELDEDDEETGEY